MLDQRWSHPYGRPLVSIHISRGVEGVKGKNVFVEISHRANEIMAIKYELMFFHKFVYTVTSIVCFVIVLFFFERTMHYQSYVFEMTHVWHFMTSH